MHFLVMSLGSSFPRPIQCLVTKLRRKNYGKTVLNEEIPVHKWQQKVKHVMKELNSRQDIDEYFIRLKKPNNRHILPHNIAENFCIIFHFFPHPIRWPA